MIGYIDDILDAVERCGTITRQLLGFARKFEVKIQKVSLKEIISDVLVFHNKEAAYRNIRVDVDVPEDMPEIETDRGKLQQVLVNLVNNAFQAMDNGCILDIAASPAGPIRSASPSAIPAAACRRKICRKFSNLFLPQKTVTREPGWGLPSPTVWSKSLAERFPRQVKSMKARHLPLRCQPGFRRR